MGTRIPTGTNTIHFIARQDVPVNLTVTYGRIVATIRPTNVKTHRVRLTVDSDRIVYSGDKSTPTADLQTIKTLLNSTISTPNATLLRQTSRTVTSILLSLPSNTCACQSPLFLMRLSKNIISFLWLLMSPYTSKSERVCTDYLKLAKLRTID